MYVEGAQKPMKQDDRQQDLFLSKLVLDMKALALLYPSDLELSTIVRTGLTDRHDEQLQRVLRSLTLRKAERNVNTVALALGQLVLGSLLMAAGIVAIAPFLIGVTNSGDLARFFEEALTNFATAPAFFPVLPELIILLSVVLLLSALYAIRLASVTLKDAGYTDR